LRRTTGWAAALLAALAWLAAPAAAQESIVKNGDPAYFSIGAGAFNVTDDEDDAAADLRLEYRHGERFFWFKPWAGIELTSEGGLWGGGGILLDLYFGRRIVVTGSTGVGGYERGDGKDLGATVEFRSQLEVAYRFDDRSRLGVAFGHISNAGIGDDNPGAEMATLYYHVPIGRLANLFD